MKGKAAFLVHACTDEQVLHVKRLHRLETLEHMYGKERYPLIFPPNLPPMTDGILADSSGDTVLEIVVVPLAPIQFIKRKGSVNEVALTAIRHAINFSKERGATVVGLGALTSPASDGGRLLVKDDGRSDLGSILLTTGNPYTSFAAADGISRLAERVGKSLDESLRIAIIGATGSVGQGLCRLLIKRGVHSRNILAIGRDPAKIDTLRSWGLKAGTMSRIREVTNTDIFIFCTSEYFDIDPNSFLGCLAGLDMTMPSIIASHPAFEASLQARGVLVEHGGIIKLPPGYTYNGVDLGIGLEHAWACEIDTAIRALIGERFDRDHHPHIIGPVDPTEAERMAQEAIKLGFQIVS